MLLFNRGEPDFESVVNASNFALFCTVINLFTKRADRVHVNEGVRIPCRARPDAAHGLRGLRHH